MPRPKAPSPTPSGGCGGRPEADPARRDPRRRAGITRLANACGAGWTEQPAAEVFAEMAGLTPTYSGISHDALGLGGIRWPCASGAEGTPRFEAAADQRLRFAESRRRRRYPP